MWPDDLLGCPPSLGLTAAGSASSAAADEQRFLSGHSKYRLVLSKHGSNTASLSTDRNAMDAATQMTPRGIPSNLPLNRATLWIRLWISVCTCQVSALTVRADKLDEQLSDADAELKRQREQFDKLAKEMVANRAERDSLQADVTKRGERIEQLLEAEKKAEGAIAELRGQLEKANQRQAELEKQCKSLDDEAKAEKVAGAKTQQELDELGKQHAALKADKDLWAGCLKRGV